MVNLIYIADSKGQEKIENYPQLKVLDEYNSQRICTRHPTKGILKTMVDEHKELVFNRESEHCVFPLDFNGRVPGGPSARFSVS